MKPGTKTMRQALAALGALYLISFGCVFQLVGAPVRTNQGNWLGPAKRFHSTTTDIGKVYYYEGTDLGAYHFYRPLCVVWLWLDGLT
jgi:hypothetical protein